MQRTIGCALSALSAILGMVAGCVLLVRHIALSLVNPFSSGAVIPAQTFTMELIGLFAVFAGSLTGCVGMQKGSQRFDDCRVQTIGALAGLAAGMFFYPSPLLIPALSCAGIALVLFFVKKWPRIIRRGQGGEPHAKAS